MKSRRTINTVVSVIIPTKNRPELLRRALRSVLMQTYTDFEVIIVDDSDNNLSRNKIPDSLLSDPRVKYEKVQGLNAKVKSCNYGILRARGDYLAFLDDDDEWYDRKLERQMKFLEADKKMDLVHCWVEYVDQSGTPCAHQKKTGTGYVYPEIISKVLIGGTNAILVKRSVVQKAGLFDERMRYYDDREWYIRLSQHCIVGCIPEVLVRMHTYHGYERMTDKNNNQNVNALQDLLVIYNANRLILQNRRDLNSIMCSRIANAFAQCGQIGSSYKWYIRAIFGSPLGYKAVKQMLRDTVAMIRG